MLEQILTVTAAPAVQELTDHLVHIRLSPIWAVEVFLGSFLGAPEQRCVLLACYLKDSIAWGRHMQSC